MAAEDGPKPRWKNVRLFLCGPYVNTRDVLKKYEEKTWVVRIEQFLLLLV